MGRTLTKALREQAKLKYPGKCGYCGVETQKIHIDHIRAVANGGTDHIDNLMPSCFGCNNYKMTWSLEFFRQNIAEQIERSRRLNINFRLAERYGLITITDKPIVFYFERTNPAQPDKG